MWTSLLARGAKYGIQDAEFSRAKAIVLMRRQCLLNLVIFADTTQGWESRTSCIRILIKQGKVIVRRPHIIVIAVSQLKHKLFCLRRKVSALSRCNVGVCHMLIGGRFMPVRSSVERSIVRWCCDLNVCRMESIHGDSLGSSCGR